MSQIEWTTLISVGNEEIDKQHRRWVEIFNRLEASLNDPSAEENDRLDLLKQILDFTREHFIEEERLMALNGYPHIVRHRRMHKEFELQLYEKFRLVMGGEMVLQSELIALIRNWFINHTSSEDKKAFEYIHSHNHGDEAR